MNEYKEFLPRFEAQQEFENSLPLILEHFVKDETKRNLVKNEIVSRIENTNLADFKNINFSRDFVETVFRNINKTFELGKEDSDSVLAISEALSTWSKMSF